MDGVFVGFPNDRPVSSLTQSEWIKIFRDVIKQNNGAGLYYSLRKLPDALKNICEEAVDGSNLLEFAILHSSWTAAHLLASFISNPSIKIVDPLNFKADEDKWANAIHVILKNYLKTREIQSLHKESYQSALKERMKAYLIAFNNGCVNLFSSVKYPRTFILLHKLGADIRQKDDQKRTVLHALLDNKSALIHVKLCLLRYIMKVAPEMLFEPSGTEGISPILYCYKNNLAKVIHEVNLPISTLSGLRTTSGLCLADLVSLAHMSKYLDSKQLVDLFTQDGVLCSLLKRASKSKISFQLPEISLALEIMVQQNKPISADLKEYYLPYIRAYLLELGVKDVKLGELQQFQRKSKLVESEKKRIENRMLIGSKNFVGHFPLDRLPADMLSLLAVHLSLQDMIALFSVSKVMRDKFNSPHNSESTLWKIIAKNTFNKVKFSMREQIGINNDRNWKNTLIKDSRLASNWTNKKFTERPLSNIKGVWKAILSEHWACWNINNITNCIGFWNCETDETTVLKPQNVAGFSYMDACFVESSLARDPIIAVSSLMGSLALEIYSPSGLLSTIALPTTNSFKTKLLDKNHVVVGDYLAVVDISQEKVVRSAPPRTSWNYTVNKFSTSPIIISTNYERPEIKLYDANLEVVQTIPWQHRTYDLHLYALDEHRILLFRVDCMYVIDTRFTKESEIYNCVKFPSSNYFTPYSTPTLHAVDEVNGRLVLHTQNYQLSMLWDLQTMTWSSMWRHSNRVQQIALNSRYQLNLDLQGCVQLYDFSSK